MTIAAVADVLARMDAIQARFAPTLGFSQALQTAAAGQAADGESPMPAPQWTSADPAAGGATASGVPAPEWAAAGTAAGPGGSSGVLAPTWASVDPAKGRTSSAPGSGAIGASTPGAAGVAAGPSAEGPANSGPGWASRLPAAGQRWAGAIQTAAQQAGIDPPLLASLVWAESGFRADAGSSAGAIGLAQLMPGTARGLGVDPYDPAANLLGGARYLRAQLDRFGSPELALAAYNAGPNRVAQAGGIPRIAETQAYVPKVLGYYAKLR